MVFCIWVPFCLLTQTIEDDDDDDEDQCSEKQRLIKLTL